MLGSKRKRFIRGLFGSMVCTAFAVCPGLQSPPEAASDVQSMFDLSHPAGRFPSDRFTVRHSSQNTGLRINLPRPDCTARPTDCEHIDLLNELDGFNPPTAAVRPVQRPHRGLHGEQSEHLTDEARNRHRSGYQLACYRNQPIVWDVVTNTLHVEPDELLEQHTRYAFLVTKHLLNADGKAVKAAKSFQGFVDDSINGSTGDPGLAACRMLLRDILRRLDAAGVIARGQVAGTVFTTQSVTAVLEKIRDQIKAATPDAADLNLGPGGTRTVFPLSDVAAIV